MAKTLVTGGAGFIGSNLVRELLRRGDEVTVLDDMSLGAPDNLAEAEGSLEIVEGDVRDAGLVDRCMQGVDRVYHNAARSTGPMHDRDPVEGADVNVTGFLTVMEVARRQVVDSLVYASTSSIYGSQEPPHREHNGEYPINFYAASKLCREHYARVYAETYGMHVIGLRHFSVYGPYERNKGKYANLVSQFIWDIHMGRSPVVYGDGTQTRDFTHVDDIVRGYLLAAESDASGETVNLGTGTETSLNRLVDILNRIMETDVKPEYVGNPLQSYVSRTRADLTRAQQIIGYEPSIDLETGVRRTVEHYTE